MAITVTTRSGKGSPLTQTEMDTNLTSLARAATTDQAGNVELATVAETVAGTATNLAVTPEGVSEAITETTSSFEFDFTQAAEGRYEFPGGLLAQWGYQTIAASTTTITWPVAFQTIYTVYATDRSDSVPGGRDQTTGLNAAPTATSAEFTTNTGIAGFYWLALGQAVPAS